MYKIIETLVTTEGEIIAICERFASDIATAGKIIIEIHETNRKFGMVQGRQYEVELTEVA